MRTVTITIKVFKFDELSDTAKENAISRYAQTDSWSDDYQAVLRDFCDRFNVEVRRWDVSPFMPVSRSIFVYGMENPELCGLRLRTWIVNNFWYDLYEGKYYSTPFKKVRKSKKHPAGLSYRFRHSRIILDERCLTGFCAGYTILDAIRKFLKDGWKNEPHKTWKNIVEECVDDFFDSWKKNMEYELSKEGFSAVCEGNDYEFTEDGMLYVA